MVNSVSRGEGPPTGKETTTTETLKDYFSSKSTPHTLCILVGMIFAKAHHASRLTVIHSFVRVSKYSATFSLCEPSNPPIAYTCQQGFF